MRGVQIDVAKNRHYDRILGMPITKIPTAIERRIERYLGPDADDDLFAKCMADICQGYGPDCSYHHTCMHGGDCFDGKPRTKAAKLLSGLKGETPKVEAILRAVERDVRDGKYDQDATVLKFQSDFK